MSDASTDRDDETASVTQVSSSVAEAGERAPRAPFRLPVVTIAVILVLMAIAGVVRSSDLRGPDGRLQTDEARLALASTGVLEHGVPEYPSGRVSTRGLPVSYLVAAAFAVFGRHDYAARLPSVFAGVALVPVVFLFARSLVTAAWPNRSALPLSAALAAATFVLFAAPLVEWSQRAWPPSIFLLAFTLSAYGCYRGFVQGSGRWQVVGAAAFVVAQVTYEFALLVPLGLLAYFGWARLAHCSSWNRGLATTTALALLVFGIAAFAVLAVVLRAGTVAGPTSEVTAFVRPRGDLTITRFYYSQVVADYWAFWLSAIGGLLVLARREPGGAVYLGVLLVASIAIPCLVIPRTEPRYVLPALVLVAILAPVGAIALVASLGRRAPSTPHVVASRIGLSVLTATLALAAWSALSGDVAEAMQRLHKQPGRTWLQTAQRERIRQQDLVLTNAITKISFYLRAPNFYVDGGGWSRYSYQAADGIRSIYADSQLLLEPGDFDRLIVEPHRGRNLWLILLRDDVNFWNHTQGLVPVKELVRSADRKFSVGDWLFVKVRL